MNLDKYVEQKVDSIIRNKRGTALRAEIIEIMKEAMRDQRYGCAEAVAALTPDLRTVVSGLVDMNTAHQAVMNAEPKEQS